MGSASGGPAQVLRFDNGSGFISEVLRGLCPGHVGLDHIPPGTPWNNGTTDSFNSRMRRGLLNRNQWTCLLEARVAIADYEHEHDSRQPTLALEAGLPHSGRVRCPMQAHSHPGGLRDRRKHGNAP